MACVVFGTNLSQAQSNKKNQLEDLFLWKVSDELKLTNNEEKAFEVLLKNLSNEKQKLNEELEAIIIQLANPKNEVERKQLLTNYRKKLINYGQISVTEFDQLKKLFGAKRMGQYLRIKSNLSAKVKSLMLERNDGTKDKNKLPPPKVIEQ